MVRPRATRAQLVAALLCGVLGFAAAVQVRSNQDAGLAGLRQTDLIRILDTVSERSARLQAEARQLENAKERLAGGSDGSKSALEEARRRSLVLGILAGTKPAKGPGIVFTISDPEGKVRSDLLLDALQELRDAGAEAVEIRSPEGPAVRVVASTSFSDAEGGAVLVDDTRLVPPYVFRVIGDPLTLAGALDIPGGVIDVLDQNDALGTVTQTDELVITSLRSVPKPEYARPAPEGAVSN
jgi:uncharacterized protein YlxW (UPF0749 family)